MKDWCSREHIPLKRREDSPPRESRTGRPAADSSRAQLEATSGASKESPSRNKISAEYKKCTIDKIIEETRQGDFFVTWDRCRKNTRLSAAFSVGGAALQGLNPKQQKYAEQMMMDA